MIINETKHSISSIFILFLLLIFILTAIVTITFGSKVYSETVSNMDDNFVSRTAVAYLTQKIRMSDCLDMIEVRNISGKSVLCLYQDINGYSYITYLYEYDNSLYEYFTRSDLDFQFENGNAVIELSNLEFEFIKDNLLQISFIDESGNCHSLLLAIRSGEVFYA